MTNATESGCCGSMQGSAKHEASSSALAILAGLFARGEIDRAEFEEKRQIIAELPGEVPSAKSRTKNCCC